MELAPLHDRGFLKSVKPYDPVFFTPKTRPSTRCTVFAYIMYVVGGHCVVGVLYVVLVGVFTAEESGTVLNQLNQVRVSWV